MNRHFITTLAFFLCIACSKENWNEPMESRLTICGNQISSFEDESRGHSIQLQNNDQIAFYSQNGIEANGVILTLTNNYWHGETALSWTDFNCSAFVNAYFPPLPTSASQLYTSDGQLKDVLIAQGEYLPNSPINLQFKHLFSLINFHVESRLNNNLKELSFTCSHKISGINPYNGQISTERNEINTQSSHVTFRPNSTGIYSLILPPGENLTIGIYLETKDDRILQKEINNINCIRNQAYSCLIKEKSQDIGIFTAEDFIAFTHLINQKEYKGRSLDEFGKTEHGKTCYFLKNDITFSEEEKKNILQIGMSYPFQDTFDGQGFTLYNLGTSQGKNEYEGVFALTDAVSSIKNLTIANSKISYSRQAGYASILCGKNKGKIINCRIQNCSISLDKPKVGGLVGKNEGLIINCDIDGLQLMIPKEAGNKVKSRTFGAISCLNSTVGKILNCRIVNLSRNSKVDVSLLSAMTCTNNNIQSNCLCDYCSSDFHPFCNKKAHFPDHCYYHNSMINQIHNDEELVGIKLGDYNIYAFKHDDTYMNKILNALNDWVDKEGKEKYPNYTFRRWKLNPGYIITFE